MSYFSFSCELDRLIFRAAIKDFIGRMNFLFCWASGADSIALSGDFNKIGMQRKVLVLIKPNPESTMEKPFPNGHEVDIIFMEITKPILENMHNITNVSKQLISLKIHPRSQDHA